MCLRDVCFLFDIIEVIYKVILYKFFFFLSDSYNWWDKFVVIENILVIFEYCRLVVMDKRKISEGIDRWVGEYKFIFLECYFC